MLKRHLLLPALWEKSGGICALCDKPLEAIASTVHIDHIIPKAMGGSDDEANLQVVHPSCNSRKGQRPVSEAVVRIRTTPLGPSQSIPAGHSLVSFHMPQDLLDRVEDYRFAHRWPSRSALIKSMITTTLEHVAADEP